MLPRYRRPALRPIGRRAARVRPVRQIEYAAVALRAQGRCELCGHAQDPLDPHHAFGRGHLPGIPASVCETRELILGICHSEPATGHQGCHEAIHAGGTLLERRARWIAMERFAARHALPKGPGDIADDLDPDPESEADWEPDDLDVMRELVRELEARTG